MNKSSISFRQDMVDAIVSGRKTQTRRLVNVDGLDLKNLNPPYIPKQIVPIENTNIKILVLGVRAQKLQDISEKDAIKEGVRFFYTEDGEDSYYAIKEDEAPCGEDPIEVFLLLWNSIYGADSWDSNPWVWVIDFKVLEAGK